jgi:hypothetical protein
MALDPDAVPGYYGRETVGNEKEMPELLKNPKML